MDGSTIPIWGRLFGGPVLSVDAHLLVERLLQNIAMPTEERFPASNVESIGQRSAWMGGWA
jgi:hypothetical protein